MPESSKLGMLIAWNIGDFRERNGMEKRLVTALTRKIDYRLSCLEAYSKRNTIDQVKGDVAGQITAYEDIKAFILNFNKG